MGRPRARGGWAEVWEGGDRKLGFHGLWDGLMVEWIVDLD